MTKIGQKKTVKLPPKPKKKSSRAVQKRRLDVLFGEYIRNRADNKCQYCGKSGVRVESHHGVVHRRYMNTRYEPDNCICVCGGCHRFLSDFPALNAEFFKKLIGTDRVEQLEVLARSQTKPDLDEIERKLKDVER